MNIKASATVYYKVTYFSPNALTVNLTSLGVTVNAAAGNGTKPSGTASIYSGGTTTTPIVAVTSGTSGDGTLGITVNAGTAHDAAGNLSTISSASSTCTVMTTIPSVASIIGPFSDTGCTIAAPYIKASATVYYQVTYSSPNPLSVNLTNLGITLYEAAGNGSAPTGTASIYSGGTTTTPIVAVTSGASGDGTLSITVNAGTAYDAAGNLSTISSASSTCTVMTTIPNVSVSGPYTDGSFSTALTAAKNGMIAYYKVQYSSLNALSLNLSPSDVTFYSTTSGATSPAYGSIVIGNGTAFGATTEVATIEVLTLGGDGTLGISIAAWTATDNANNGNLASSASGTYYVENSPVSTSITGPFTDGSFATALTAAKSGTTAFFKVSYSTPNPLTVTLTSSDLSYALTGTASGSANVMNYGSYSTVAVTTGIGDGTLGINIPPGAAHDAGSVNSCAAASSSAYIVDNTAPFVSSISLVSNGSNPAFAKNGDTVTLNFTPIDANLSGSASVTIRSASGTTLKTASPSVTNGTDCSSVSFLAPSSPTYDGTLQYSITLTDLAGNSTTVTSGAPTNVTLDNTGPGQPTGVSAAAQGNGTITVSWSNTSDSDNTGGSGLALFVVSWYQDGFPSLHTGSMTVIGATSTVATTPVLTSGILYDFTVTPYDSAGNAGMVSSVATATASTGSTTLIVYSAWSSGPDAQANVMSSATTIYYWDGDSFNLAPTTSVTVATGSPVDITIPGEANKTFSLCAFDGMNYSSTQVCTYSGSSYSSSSKSLRGGGYSISKLNSGPATARARPVSFAPSPRFVPYFNDQVGVSPATRAPSAELVVQPVSLVAAPVQASKTEVRELDVSGLSILQRHADTTEAKSSESGEAKQEARFIAPAQARGSAASAPSRAVSHSAAVGGSQARFGAERTPGARSGIMAKFVPAQSSQPRPSRGAPSPVGAGSPVVDLYAEQEDDRAEGREERKGERRSAAGRICHDERE